MEQRAGGGGLRGAWFGPSAHLRAGRPRSQGGAVRTIIPAFAGMTNKRHCRQAEGRAAARRFGAGPQAPLRV